MKKQIIALILVALMALTVLSAAAVTTTTRVEAASPAYYNVRISENAKWTSTQFNEHTQFTYHDPQLGRSVEYARSWGGTAYSFAAVPAHSGVPEGESQAKAFVGVKLRLDPSEESWDQVKTMPVAVKITLGWNLLANGGRTPLDYAGADILPSGTGHYIAQTSTDLGIPVSTGYKTYIVTTNTEGNQLTVGNVFFPPQPQQGIAGELGVLASSYASKYTGSPNTPIVASAHVTVYSIELLWPEPTT